MASLGRSSESSLRLCSRAPRTTSRSATVRSVSPGLCSLDLCWLDLSWLDRGWLDLGWVPTRSRGDMGPYGACKARRQSYPGLVTISLCSRSADPAGRATLPHRPEAPDAADRATG